MKRPEKVCANPKCNDRITDYKSTRRKFCSSPCKNSFHHNKKLEEQEDSIANERAIKRLKRFLKEMEEMEIDSFVYKKESYFFNNIVLPTKQTFIHDDGEEYLVSRLDNFLVHKERNTKTIKLFKHGPINKTLF